MGGGKYFEFKRETVFGLRHPVSKHKTLRYAGNFEGHGPLGLRLRLFFTKMVESHL